MAEELRDWFDAAFYRGLARVVKAEHRPFQDRRFIAAAVEGLDGLSLMERLERTATLLGEFLPQDYAQALAVVMAVTPHYRGQFRALLGPAFVARYGRHDPMRSLEALRRLTACGSSEFAVRHFLKDDFEGTLRVMRGWAEDGDHHVRRLASEGCRPRLPWSFRLERLVADPEPAIPILERLQADPEPYVRTSVANHLNDIAKDHPGRMLDLVSGWDRENPATAWIVRHACRSLIKAGDARALALHGFGQAPEVEVRDLEIAPRAIPWEGAAVLSFVLVSRARGPQRLAVDYIVHYVKASGATAPKVFKLREVELAAGEVLAVTTRRSFQQRTTRRHYPGRHRIDVQINGVVCAGIEFDLLGPPGDQPISSCGPEASARG